jgi:hypothetical protein
MGGTVRNQNFRMASGDDVDLVVTVRNSDDSAVVSLVGASALWVLSDEAGCTPRLSKTGTLTDAANGLVTVSLTADDTGDLDGVYYHEMQITDGVGKISTVLTGRAWITADSAP